MSTDKINTCKRLFNIVRILIQNKLKILKNKAIFCRSSFFSIIFKIILSHKEIISIRLRIMRELKVFQYSTKYFSLNNLNLYYFS